LTPTRSTMIGRRKKQAGATDEELAKIDNMIAKQEVIVFGEVITPRLVKDP